MSAKLKNLIFILILGSVSVGLLMGIRAYTAPIIERDQEMNLKGTILDAAGISHTKEDLDAVFEKDIRKMKAGDLDYYMGPDNSYIFEYKGRGLWGMIEGVITLKPDLETIQSLKIVSQEETPGLGGRIGEETFLGQFRNKKVMPELMLAQRTKAMKDNEIDAITGATITSKALIDTINEAVEEFRKTVKR